MGSPTLLVLALASLSLLATQTAGQYDEGYEYAYYDYTEAPEAEMDFDLSWLTDLLVGIDESDECNPNPCLNNGVCENLNRGGYQCHCSPLYKGKNCQKFDDPCKNVKCNSGDCVLTADSPYHECRCREPYKGSTCRKAAPCRPSPCLNGGRCEKGRGRTRSSFECQCPSGYSGKLCQVGPSDCYSGNGESYRGFVSETSDGKDCLPWNSHLIPSAVNLTQHDEESGLGPHKYCRNPDGDVSPWCFYKKRDKLDWEYCNVKECTAKPDPEVKPDVIPPPPPPSQDFGQCGKPEPVRAAARIFGGRKALPAAYPWQASIQVRTRGSSRPFQHICGGILVGSCWVLTAAHCLNDMHEMQVELGGVGLDKAEDSEQIIAVEKAMMHEDYRESPDALYNDVAMLKLKGPKGQCAKETRYVKTACLPTGPFPDNSECTISGWGKTETGEASKQLLAAKVRLIPMSSCSAPGVYGNRLDQSMFCAGFLEGGVDSCQGDSGGPLTCEKDGTHYVYGVVSWGDMCGEKNKPGVYARVNHFIDWIAAKLLTE
ncbi:hyaluronan-binding protein 2-like [Engraulis encrasicolus]|uniref:hyaluronan-binding protein 2-like n=1 Tax=Engraulis encrasicolus TaxID=184585 RepID=UPI002FD02421